MKTNVQGGLDRGHWSEADLTMSRVPLPAFGSYDENPQGVREEDSTEKEALGSQEIFPHEALSLETNSQIYLGICLIICGCKNKWRGHGLLTQRLIYWGQLSQFP